MILQSTSLDIYSGPELLFQKWRISPLRWLLWGQAAQTVLSQNTLLLILGSLSQRHKHISPFFSFLIQTLSLNMLLHHCNYCFFFFWFTQYSKTIFHRHFYTQSIQATHYSMLLLLHLLLHLSITLLKPVGHHLNWSNYLQYKKCFLSNYLQ